MISLGMSRSGLYTCPMYNILQDIPLRLYIYTMYIYDSDSSSDIYDNMLESYMPTVRIVFKIYITNNDDKEYWNSSYNPGNIQG